MLLIAALAIVWSVLGLALERRNAGVIDSQIVSAAARARTIQSHVSNSLQ
jgi:hypothetical protein